MKKIIANHKSYWSQKSFVYSALIGFVLFVVSLVVNYFAGIYATEVASNVVTDIILSNVPVMNVNAIFIEGFLVFVAFIALLAIREPKRLPFVLKCAASFIIIRSAFITLTHIGPFPQTFLEDEPAMLKAFTSGADLFFSAHTGLPFLFALMFWEQYYLRSVFLIFSFVAGASVLLGHLHYSIDVAAAFFITHSIFMIAKRVYKKDFELFNRGLIEAE